MNWEGFFSNLNNWEHSYSQQEIDQRIEDWGTLHADGEWAIDFVDYTYRLVPGMWPAY